MTYPDRIGRSLGPFNPGIWSGDKKPKCPRKRDALCPQLNSVEDLTGNGFNKLTTQASQDVMGNGLWEQYGALKGGCCSGPTWRVVMKRSLATNDPNDVQFKAGSSLPVAFAVWDGQNSERGGRKSISNWYMAQMP